MFQLFLGVVAVLLTTIAFCEEKCRFADVVKPVNIRFSKLARKRVNIVYGTESKFGDVDRAYIVYTRNDDDTYNSTMTITKKTNVTKRINYTTEYRDGVLYETYNVSGTIKTVPAFVLAKTCEDALFVYSCLDIGGDDLRLVLAPHGTTISDESLIRFAYANKKLNSSGILCRLPNKI